ncbi:MAG: DUF2892 domain-containing protein [Acidimicrobiales bacterium]|jgi:DUF2892 family protein
MTKNVGTTDRAVRAAVMVAALMAAMLIGAGSAFGVLLLVVAAIMGVTAAVGTCPLYRFFHISTCPVRRAH